MSDMLYPDKLKYKSTTTSEFRIALTTSLNKSESKIFLEIGCDRCHTTLSCEKSFEKAYCVDISSDRIERSKKEILVAEKNLNKKINIELIVGTSKNIPSRSYDVILVDAHHDYEFVKKDCENIIVMNESDNYTIFFHDYGLVNAGVKKFITEYFETDSIEFVGLEQNWNPRGGPISDWEGVSVKITKDMKSYLKNRFASEAQ